MNNRRNIVNNVTAIQ